MTGIALISTFGALVIYAQNHGFILSSEGGEFSTGYMGILTPALTYERRLRVNLRCAVQNVAQSKRLLYNSRAHESDMEIPAERGQCGKQIAMCPEKS